MRRKFKIFGVEPGSIADEFGVEPGDFLISVNNNNINDVFDYRYLIKEEYLEILLEKADREQWLLEIEKDSDEDLGLVFESGLMDKERSCKNKCIFCFIDQLPKDMRKTLYFKDDDFRLSFLTGNYVSLTNAEYSDIERIIYYHLSPINISIHTMDAELRRFMLKNPSAGDVADHIKRLADAGIEMNFQIVLCKGINDGENLDHTIKSLTRFIPAGKSLSVVPVGLTKYREQNGLPYLYPFIHEDYTNIIRQIQDWQSKLKAEYGTNFVFASDEFYLKAGLPIPEYSEYEDFPQIENGVGMLTMFKNEFYESLKYFKNTEMIGNETPAQPTNHQYSMHKKISLATGLAAYDFMYKLSKDLMLAFPWLDIDVYGIYNEFFGENIDVSGLLTGRDIISQLAGKQLGNALFIPINSLRAGEDIFLDDISVEELGKNLDVSVIPARNNNFVEKILLYKGN